MPQVVTNQAGPVGHRSLRLRSPARTVVIVGLGDMGGTAARERSGSPARIGIRHRARPHRYADEILELRYLRRALRQADFIFVAAPLTPASRHLLGEDMLASTKAGRA